MLDNYIIQTSGYVPINVKPHPQGQGYSYPTPEDLSGSLLKKLNLL